MNRRPRLAPGFTVMTDASAVWVVAGEDVRYRLGAAEPAWLSDLLARCDGSRTIDELATHADARGVIDQLLAERVLVDATAAQAHAPVAGYRVIGTLPGLASTGDDIDIVVQDALDHRALLAINREMLAARRRWMWITTGPGGRAYIGPLFVPDAGPCAACLLVHFKRLSPVPALYDVVLAHDGAIAPSPFPAEALGVVAAFARWKLAQTAALYLLHVVETSDLTITAHAPLADVECEACR